MLKAFFTSATGMRAQEMMIDNTANNLANVNTTGFKRKHLHFADLIYDVSKEPGTATSQNENTPVGIQIGNGVQAVGTTSNHSDGATIPSAGDTHMAIRGDGYFRVLLSDGTAGYTRDGSFSPDGTGRLVNSSGHLLDPAVTVPEGAIVSIDGSQISFTDAQGNALGQQQIQLYRFANPDGLKQLGNNLLQASTASGQQIEGIPGENGFGTIKSGEIEVSNVEVVTELVSLISAQRAYEINSRAIRAGDEMLSTTSQIVR